MNLTHHKWTKSGRTFKTEKPNQFVYKSVCGQKNVEVSEGEYAPYVWDSENDSIRYTGFVCEFHDWFQVIKRFDTQEILIDDQRFEVQHFKGNKWRVLDLWQRELSVSQGEDHCIITKRFYDGEDNELTVLFLFRPRRQVVLSATLRVKDAGLYRIRFQNTGIAGELREKLYAPLGEPPTTDVIGLLFDAIRFDWLHSETDIHAYEIETQAGGKKLDIFWGPFELEAGGSGTISPDTWGATEASDDCMELNNATYYDIFDNRVWCGDYGGQPIHAGWKWTNVEASGTADDGCKITGYETYVVGDGCTGNLRIVNSDAPDDWGSNNRPSQQSLHDAVVAWNEPNTGTQESPEIKTLIQERFDDGDWDSGDNLAICWMDNDSGEDDRTGVVAEEFNEDVGAELTIVYTAIAAYSLVCDGGSFSLAGITTALLKSSVIVPDPGSFVFTGTAAGVFKSSLIAADPDSFALSGQTVDPLKSSAMVADAASYLLVGQVVSLLKSGKIDIEAASYILTGQNAALFKGRIIDIGAGSYVLTGQDVTLIKTALDMAMHKIIGESFHKLIGA